MPVDLCSVRLSNKIEGLDLAPFSEKVADYWFKATISNVVAFKQSVRGGIKKASRAL